MVSPIHAALAPDTKLTPPAPLAGEPLNYGEILYLSSLFYEAQRSGALPSTNRVPWRGDSALTDGADKKLDLSGGWYDAERSVMMDTIKWGLDWLLKAHHKPDALIYQVASFDDHSYWGPPESFPSSMKRPSFELNPQHPGSDIAGEVAAAFAAASLIFDESDSVYSKTLLLHARQLFDFADTHRGIGSKDFYGSRDYKDELAWAAVWLFKATGEADYLQKAELMFDACCGGRAGTTKTDYDWGDKGPGVQLLLFHITNSEKYKVGITEYLQTWLKKPKTPKGLTFYSVWGSNRYTANTAFIALMAASYGLSPEGLYVGWAQKEIDYILTAGGKVNQKSGRPEYSYVIGFGEQYERSLRRPVGKEWNTALAVREMTRPAVKVRAGVMVQPIKLRKTHRAVFSG
eukprot:evm.model.NODE_26454_length_13086_cov_40.792679.1